MGFLDYANAIASKYGQKRILSDRVRIFVKSEGKHVKVGEFDSFSVTDKEAVRIFKPVGSTREISLITPGGHDLAFSGGKVDWTLARLMHRQELMTNAHKIEDVIAAPIVGYNIFDLTYIEKAVNIAPKFEVEHTITHYNGNIESFIYEDTMLFGYSIEQSADLGVVTESVKGFSPRKTRNGITFINDELLKPSANAVVENMVAQLIKNEYNTLSVPVGNYITKDN